MELTEDCHDVIPGSDTRITATPNREGPGSILNSNNPKPVLNENLLERSTEGGEATRPVQKWGDVGGGGGGGTPICTRLDAVAC